jgi:nitroimidazol reductase NimA-like FMN-containing flavoprotein (pyridoxamine 5'-phosphate oxidase superfamily)
MRRKEKEISERGKIDEILQTAEIVRIAFARDNEPYLVPLFFGYDGRGLYVHTACEGKKIDFIAANSRVCFEVERNVHILPYDSDACKWSARFESVIGFGRVTELVRAEDREYGLNQIMLHYSGKEWRFDPSALENTRVWRIDIETMSCKCSKG